MCSDHHAHKAFKADTKTLLCCGYDKNCHTECDACRSHCYFCLRPLPVTVCLIVITSVVQRLPCTEIGARVFCNIFYINCIEHSISSPTSCSQQSNMGMGVFFSRCMITINGRTQAMCTNVRTQCVPPKENDIFKLGNFFNTFFDTAELCPAYHNTAEKGIVSHIFLS